MPTDPIKAASALLKQQRPAQEILALVASISQSHPQFIDAQHVRALCAQRFGDPARAEALLLDVLNRDPRRIGLRYPVDAGVAGDAGLSLQALNGLLERKQERGFLERAWRNRP